MENRDFDCPVPTEISVCASSQGQTRSSTRSSQGSSRGSSSRTLSRGTRSTVGSSYREVYFENNFLPTPYNYNDIPDDASSISDPSAYLSKTGRRRKIYDRRSLLRVINAGNSLHQMRGVDTQSHYEGETQERVSLSTTRRYKFMRRVADERRDNHETPPRRETFTSRLRALNLTESPSKAAALSSSRSVASSTAARSASRTLRSTLPVRPRARPMLSIKQGAPQTPGMGAFSEDSRFDFKDGLFVLKPGTPTKSGSGESTVTDNYNCVSSNEIRSGLSGSISGQTRPTRQCDDVNPLIRRNSFDSLPSVPSESPVFDNDTGFVYKDGMFVPKLGQRRDNNAAAGGDSNNSRNSSVASKKHSVEDDTTTERYSGIGKNEDVDLSTYRESGQESLSSRASKDTKGTRSTKSLSTSTIKGQTCCKSNSSKQNNTQPSAVSNIKSEDIFTPKYIGTPISSASGDRHRHRFHYDYSSGTSMSRPLNDGYVVYNSTLARRSLRSRLSNNHCADDDDVDDKHHHKQHEQLEMDEEEKTNDSYTLSFSDYRPKI